MSPEAGLPQADAAPFSSDGGAVGVLVLHGFSGSPRTVREWAQYLAAAGLTVRAPLLAGHGGTWQELGKTGWTDWYASAESAFAELTTRCSERCWTTTRRDFRPHPDLHSQAQHSLAQNG